MSLNIDKIKKRTCAFYTFGCKVNQYETQVIREQFFKEGFIETKNDPDYFIVNGCTVTASADRKCRSLLKSLHKKNPKSKIILTGCYAKNYSNVKNQDSGIIGVIDQDEKFSLVDLVKKNKSYQKLKSDKNEYNISDFAGHSRAFVKIQDGCNNFCSYCIVAHMRGLPTSKNMQLIIDEVAGLAKRGFKEIVLTGINIGTWAINDNEPKGQLPELIKKLVEIKELHRLRLSSVELAHVDDLLIEQFKNSKKLCPHLHIPLQSADDHILKEMNRR